MFLREGVNTKAFASAEKELKSYAGKHGGIDKKDFMDVAKMLGQISRVNILQAGQVLGQLNRKLQGMDTDPRDKVYSVLKKQGLMESVESLKEKMTEKQMNKREKIVKSMKKDKKGFEDRYGDKADAVMYATATKMAMDEGHDPKHVKMAIGIATDKRYKGGNMTGAVRNIEKIKKGLSDHPQVKAVLQRVNEKLDADDKPFVKKLIKNLRKGSATHGKQADDLEKAMTSEDIERRADVKMVKVRLPDGTQVMRRQRPEIKIGEKKSPNAVRTEETINEGVIEDLKKIVKRKARADVKFANGRKTKVDLFTASAMTQVYDKLNDKNKQKFADAINKDERMFMKMMDFAMTKVGGK